MLKKTISDATIKRLPKYYGYLKLLEDEGVEKVSSSSIATAVSVSASQVRQDFFGFESNGQQGYGYDVKKLKSTLASILGVDKPHSMIIIGAGHIGGALAGHKGFAQEGFQLKALFDINVAQESIHGIPVYNISTLNDFLKENKVDIAVIATTKDSAQEVANTLVKGGVESIWNFAQVEIDVPKNVVVENISMLESLLVLSYKASNKI